MGGAHYGDDRVHLLADGSKRYRVRYRTPDRAQTDKRGFKTKHEAADFAASVEVSKLQGLYVQPSHGRLMTGPWVVGWLAGRGDLARSSQVRYESIINEHITPRWGKVALADVRHIDIQRWCTDLTRKGLAAATVDKVHRVLSQALDLAVQDQRIPRNPAAGVKIARPKISPRRYLTHTQVEAFAEAAGQWGDVIRVLAYTGIRWGEMAALEVGSIDLVRRRASIHRTVVDTKGAWSGRTRKATASERCRSRRPSSAGWPACSTADRQRSWCSAPPKHCAARRQRPADLVEHRRHRGRAAKRIPPARAPSHSGITGHQCGRERQGRPAHARTQKRSPDP